MPKQTPIIDRLNREQWTVDQLDEIAAAVERQRRALGVGSKIDELKNRIIELETVVEQYQLDDEITADNAHMTIDRYKSELIAERRRRKLLESNLYDAISISAAQLNDDYQKHQEIAAEIRQRAKDGGEPKFDEFVLPIADRVTLEPEFLSMMNTINRDDQVIGIVLQNGGSINADYGLTFLMQTAKAAGQFAAFSAMYHAGRQVSIHDDSVIAARIMARLNFYNDVPVDHVAGLSAQFINSLKPNLSYETLRQGLIYAHRSYNANYRTVEDAAADFGVERRQLFRYREWYEKLRICRENVIDALADAIENGTFRHDL